MMDFMDSLRRGVDRAGFEMDRLLRANRVRSRINALRSQVDEEMRQIGYRVFELWQQGDLEHSELRERCERIKQYQDEISTREAELETINQEAPDSAEGRASAVAQPLYTNCPDCNASVPESAMYCPQCGVNMRTARQLSAPEQEQVGSSREQATASIDSDDL